MFFCVRFKGIMVWGIRSVSTSIGSCLGALDGEVVQVESKWEFVSDYQTPKDGKKSVFLFKEWHNNIIKEVISTCFSFIKKLRSQKKKKHKNQILIYISLDRPTLVITATTQPTSSCREFNYQILPHISFPGKWTLIVTISNSVLWIRTLEKVFICSLFQRICSMLAQMGQQAPAERLKFSGQSAL